MTKGSWKVWKDWMCDTDLLLVMLICVFGGQFFRMLLSVFLCVCAEHMSSSAENTGEDQTNDECLFLRAQRLVRLVGRVLTDRRSF